MAFEKELKMKKSIPFDGMPMTALVDDNGIVIPYEFTGWKDEVNAWVDSAYLGAAISDEWFPYTVRGEGATEFMQKYFTNNFANAPIGKSKHGMLLSDRGTIAMDGIVLRVAENEYLTACCYPLLDYFLDKEHEQGNFRSVEGIDEGMTLCLYQIGGPKSLEILEAAAGENLHDIEYLHFRNVKIAGHTVRVFRMGMAGTLSYEVHAAMDICKDVYEKIWEVGQKYNIRRLGYHAYMMNHTENGFMQACLHFFYDFCHVEGFVEWCEKKAPFLIPMCVQPMNHGSVENEDVFFVSPFDIGWGYLVNFGHDFPGKEAAWKAKNSRHREVVTLEWNAEDIADVYRSQFEGNAPYKPMENVNDYFMFDFFAANMMLNADKILNQDGQEIGISTGRGHIIHYNRMISLGSIDPDYTELGTEVIVVWGNKDYPAKKIRAKVAKFPYLKETLNGDFDVSKIPFGHLDAK